MKQCTNCGKYIDDNAPVCPYCGSQQPPVYGHQQNYGRYTGSTQTNENEYLRRNNMFDEGPDGKVRGVAALLALFFGALGVHYFYLNKTTAGLLTILLCLCSCGLWSTLMFIQGIYMLCIDNRTFAEKYVFSTSTLPLF